MCCPLSNFTLRTLLTSAATPFLSFFRMWCRPPQIDLRMPMCGYASRSGSCGTTSGKSSNPPPPFGILSLTGTSTHLPSVKRAAVTTVFSSPATPIGDPEAMA